MAPVIRCMGDGPKELSPSIFDTFAESSNVTTTGTHR